MPEVEEGVELVGGRAHRRRYIMRPHYLRDQALKFGKYLKMASASAIDFDLIKRKRFVDLRIFHNFVRFHFIYTVCRVAADGSQGVEQKPDHGQRAPPVLPSPDTNVEKMFSTVLNSSKYWKNN